MQEIDCRNCKIVKVLQEQIKRLEERTKELERRLMQYENPHTPPSKANPKRPFKPNKSRKPGRKVGHEGTTRPKPEPTEWVVAELESCPHCSHPLGEPIKIENTIIEDIPEPQPVRVIECITRHYKCGKCGRESTAKHECLPKEGRFGKNVIAEATLLKYEQRLPHRKIQETLERQYGLKVSPGSVFDFTRRASDAIRPVYEFILERIRNASILYVDETGIHVQGKKYWIWIFVTLTETFVVIRKSRGTKVLMEVLTRRFKGIIVCDGWKAYSKFTKHIQRCWAHLLREAKYLAERSKEAIPLYKALLRLYKKLTYTLREPPPAKTRKKLWYEARATLKRWLKREYTDEKLIKFIAKIFNGFDYWFTFILHPDVEPTNNRAERALREHVVQRKIIGTLRNTKGTKIHETTMTVFATWKQQDLPLRQTLTNYL